MNIEYESDALPGSRVGEVSRTPMSNFLSPGEGEGRVRDRRQEAIEEIRFRVDIVDVVAEHVSLRRAGKNYVGLCPFHQERTPSFTVSPDKQMFYCFGCQAGGDVFAFLMRREGLSFPEAV